MIPYHCMSFVVINGTKTLFQLLILKLVMFERLGRTNSNGIKTFLNSYNYKLFRINHDGQISINEEDINLPLINLFACPNELFYDLVI